MMDWKHKLTSRKFWATVANFVGMLVIALGIAEETATQVTALIMAGASVVAYIVGEGMIDAAGAATQVVELPMFEPVETKPPIDQQEKEQQEKEQQEEEQQEEA